MGKNLKKKVPKKKKTSQKSYDSGRIDWGICGRSTSDSESLQNEDELSGMNLLSSRDIYPSIDDECDGEITEFSLMGEKERCQIEVVFKGLTDKIRDQQDLLNKRECASKKKLPN